MLHQHGDNSNFEEARQKLANLMEQANRLNHDQFISHHGKLEEEKNEFEQDYR